MGIRRLQAVLAMTRPITAAFQNVINMGLIQIFMFGFAASFVIPLNPRIIKRLFDFSLVRTEPLALKISCAMMFEK